ncbi:hypothetical protein, partial [Variovorax sp.]|uniref:hypothetical protein n=1 Tax=Variovorax sp. TaxID=1871043 RepID=UPI000C4C88F7
MGTHVDDDILTGTTEYLEHAVPRLQKKFTYGKWQKLEKVGDTIVYVGIRIRWDATGALVTDQETYIKTIPFIQVTSYMKQRLHMAVSEKQRTELRGGLAKAGWVTRNTRPDVAFRVQAALQSVPTATVAALVEFNNIVKALREEASLAVRYVPLPRKIAQLQVVVSGDASFGNVDDGIASQAGQVILIGEKSKLEKGETVCSVLWWRSHKIRRKLRSTLACETHAMNEGLEAVDYFRAIFAELEYENFDIHNWEPFVSKLSAVVTTDCKSLEQHLAAGGVGVLEDRRLQIDMASAREATAATAIRVQWVATAQMIADVLTKADVSASMYMRYVLRTGKFSYREVAGIAAELKQLLDERKRASKEKDK